VSALRLCEVVQARGSGRRAVTVLHGASLSIEGGESVLLEGPSGSGKTTLLAVAAGILTPESGEVVVAGRALHLLTRLERIRHRARSIGFVFQRSNLLEGLTVLQNVVLAARLADRGSSEGLGRARELLARLGVEQLAARYPRELSGGEEQRVAVARALVHRPRVILADEPTGNLDGAAGLEVARALTGLAASDGCAVLIATHDPALAAFATRRLQLAAGRVLEDEARGPGPGG